MAIPVLFPILIGFVFVLGAVGCAVFAPQLPLAVRLFSAVLLLLVALFSVFGFLASFEPGAGHWIWRSAYVAVLIGCLGAIARLMLVKRAAGQDANMP